MAALPQIGRATRVERPVAPGVDAAGELYERYSAQIFGYCLHQLGSREEAEDAVQTTFMNAFRGLQRGIVPELESAWLFKIAHNVCLSRRRSSWRRGKVEAPNNFEVLQEVIPGREQVSDELIRLQDVLEEMPENQRRAILLREWQGLTYREISAELNLSQAAVETLIFRARRALAQGLEQDADTWKRRLRRGADVGGAIGFLKALLGGGGAAAVKVAATAIAIATTAVAATSDMPTHVQHAHARKPAAVKTTRHHARAPLSPLSSATTAHAVRASTSLARRGLVRSRQPSSGERSLPRPVSLPPAQSEPAPEAAAAPAPPAPTPAAPPAPAPSEPQATLPPPSSAPGPTSANNGKDKKDERTPQSTMPPTSNPAAPEPAEPSAQPGPADDPGQTDKGDKPDHHGKRGNGGKGGDRADKPGNSGDSGNGLAQDN